MCKKIVSSVIVIFLFLSGFSNPLQASGAQKNHPENRHKTIKNQHKKATRTPAPDSANKRSFKLPDVTGSPSAFTPQMPLVDALDILRNSTEPRLKIVVLWNDLAQNADVHRYTPIGIDGLSGISPGKSLELLLMSVSATSAGKLDYVIKGGIIIIATKESLPREEMVTRIYNVSSLVHKPADYYSSLSIGTGAYGRANRPDRTPNRYRGTGYRVFRESFEPDSFEPDRTDRARELTELLKTVIR